MSFKITGEKQPAARTIKVTVNNAKQVASDLGLPEPLVMQDAPDMVFESNADGAANVDVDVIRLM